MEEIFDTMHNDMVHIYERNVTLCTIIWFIYMKEMYDTMHNHMVHDSIYISKWHMFDSVPSLSESLANIYGRGINMSFHLANIYSIEI